MDVTVVSSGRCAVGLRGVWCCRRKHAAPRVNSATAVLLLGIGMLGITRSYDAPRFMEYRSADQVPNGTCIEANGCNTGPFLILGNDGPLPFITPPDGHIFSAEIGGVISFHVAGEQGAAASSPALTILFEEDPTLMNDGAFSYTPLEGNGGASSIDKDHFKAKSNAIARKYSLTVNKFAPSKLLTMCFRILEGCKSLSAQWFACASADPGDRLSSGPDRTRTVDCCFKTPRPETPQSAVWAGMGQDPLGKSDLKTTAERPCWRDKDGLCFDDRFYPRRCVRMYVAVPPQIVSVLPVDESQRDGSITVMAASHAWMRNASASNVVLRVGQMLRLNIDAIDPNEEDDIDIEPDANVELPSGTALGPRMCCDDKFTACRVLARGSMQCKQVLYIHIIYSRLI